ncbi:MAG: nucleotide pyrophosphohydrolase [Candidatus Moranbacteria bacterium]|nr:nucleotide pyrophosphohydrolase [Candidatus Moranbacteria bacterium]
MELKQIIDRAAEIKEKYHELERKKYGKTWTNAQIMEGFVVDIGDLMKIIMAKDNLREMENIEEKLEHELADCLYSICVLSHKYNVDLEKAFLKTMDYQEKQIADGKEE